MNHSTSSGSIPLAIHPSVQIALDNNHPVVALESTIISHGMPYPQNHDTALNLELIVRQHGATPATIAVIDGIANIGLTNAQLQILSKPSPRKVHKLAIRDLPLSFAQKHHGATTVSATMYLSFLAGIKIFATGGIGGVHRKFENTSWDISADISALSRFPVLVVSAGIKSILDIPQTLEALETANVPVFVLNEDEFPAFYTRKSGQRAPATVKDVRDAAMVFKQVFSSLNSGALLAVPLPKNMEPDADQVQKAIDISLREIREKQQTGEVRPAQVTPFMLKRIAELTGGASLRANISLVKHNAAIAAQIAVELSKTPYQCHSSHSQTRLTLLNKTSSINVNNIEVRERQADIIVVGASVLDILARPANGQKKVKSTLPGNISMRPGGVALNVAKAAHCFSNVNVQLLSAVGDDAQGKALLSLLLSDNSTQAIRKHNVEGEDIREQHVAPIEIFAPVVHSRRGAVVAIANDEHGDLQAGVADTDELFGNTDAPLYQYWKQKLEVPINSIKIVVIDSNLCVGDIRNVVHASIQTNAQIWLEPTSVAKCTRLVEADVLGDARFISPNELEAITMSKSLKQKSKSQSICDNGEIQQSKTFKTKDEALEDAAKTILSLSMAHHKVRNQSLLITRGEEGVSKFYIDSGGCVAQKDFSAKAIPSLVSTTGAGDCFAGCCAGYIANGIEEDRAIQLGIIAASASCISEESVPDERIFKRMLKSESTENGFHAKL